MSRFVVFVTPFYKPSVGEFVEALLRHPGVNLAVVTQDPAERLPETLRQKVLYQHVGDATYTPHLVAVVHHLSSRYGKIHRLLAINEQIQVQVAEVREQFGIFGMPAETIRNFRDKSRMKHCFRQAGVPCARHKAATNFEEARSFLQEVGYPVCVKPVDGAAAQATFRVDSDQVLEEILKASSPSPDRPLQIEEFVVGDEHSFETLSVGGVHHWHSVTHYYPTPLSVVANPWIQWRIVSPRDIEHSRYDDIRQAGCQALDALGMQTGLTHLEWFRRPDESIAISEVAARPPGAQIVTMLNRAHDMDLFRIWVQMMIDEEMPEIPPRKYATGVAFLRGLGGGRVRGVHGIDKVLGDLGLMVTDMKLPMPGDPAANTYEGEGFVLVRHPDTQAVERALLQIVDQVRVELI